MSQTEIEVQKATIQALESQIDVALAKAKECEQAIAACNARIEALSPKPKSKKKK